MGSDVDYNISERRWKLIMDGPLNVKDESDFGNGDLVSRQYFCSSSPIAKANGLVNYYALEFPPKRT